MLNQSLTSIFTGAKLFVLILFLGQDALGQFDSEYLIRTMDSLFFSEEGDNRPGYSIAVLKDNSIIYQRSKGQINLEKKIEFTENSMFAIASCTKQFTAFGVLLLEQEGKVELTDDIRKYIPELPEFEHTITIKHLLSHTSGIRDHITLLGWENKQWSKYYTFKGTIRALQKYQGLSFQPGEDFAYSNTGYVLLAYLIERVSGTPIQEFMQTRIFEPLEMNTTQFVYKREYQNFGFSRPYNYNWEKEKFITYRRLEVNAMGAVGIYTTINDFIKWDQNFTTMKVGNAILFDKFVQSDTLKNGMIINYNNGLKERYVRGYHVVEHSGGWAYYNFQYLRIPEIGLSVIVASNNELDYPIGMVETYIKTLLPTERIPAIESKETKNETLKSGTYIADNFNIRTISEDAGGLKISAEHLYGANSYDLSQLPNGNYRDSTGSELIPNSVGTSFRWTGGSYFNVPREFYLLDTVTPDLTKYAGKYENAELGTLRIHYKKKQGTIMIKSSFGKNPKVREMIGKYIDLESAQYDLLFKDENTLIIGNGAVFNLEFTRK